jgi:hypothetical protein
LKITGEQVIALAANLARARDVGRKWKRDDRALYTEDIESNNGEETSSG